MKEKITHSSKLFALKQILEGTADYTGKKFFASLVKNLSQVLKAHGVWVTEYLRESGKLNSLAFYLDGKFVEEYCYDVKNTPCERVLETNEICHFPDRLIHLFPDDPDLPGLNAVSYLGIALRDTNGEILGHLAVLDSKIMKEIPEFFAVFRIFASRAAAELRRLKREQELIESGDKLERILNSTSEAILETDRRLMITHANKAAEKELGLSKEKINGVPLEKFLEPEGFEKLQDAIKNLDIKKPESHTTRLRGKLVFYSAAKKKIPAKVSLSGYRYREMDFYSFFIKNVKEKEQTEMALQKLYFETDLLRKKVKENFFSKIIGKSPQILSVLNLISKVAETNSTVLITGETGTGKELIAEAIYRNSKRKDKAFVSLNCAALPSDIIESELFGHVKGAFTGAVNAREGRFALANTGTIFLDEIGEMPLRLQSKLLRVIQEGEFEPVGSSKTQKTDVRIIAATHRDLKEEVEKGNFREDLYYRLNVFPIPVPPLRERSSDIVLLAEAFMEKLAVRSGKKLKPLDEAAKQVLYSHPWPGNVRELQNIIERAVIISSDGELDFSSILPKKEVPEKLNTENEERIYNEEEIMALQKKNLLLALHKTGWKVSGKNGAASLLRIAPSTFASRMIKYGINKYGSS